MQKKMKVLEALLESEKELVIKEEEEQDDSIKSYAQFIKLMSSLEVETFDALNERFSDVVFAEDDDVLYNSLSMAVNYVQLPIVADADVMVKVVQLVQGETMVIIVPEKVAETYHDLLDSPELIKDKNINLALYAEVYGLNPEDEKLQELIKSVFLSAGGSISAFELKDDLAKRELEEKDEDDEDMPNRPKPSKSPGKPDTSSGAFDSISKDIESSPEIEVNEEAYKLFRKQSDSLDKLAKDIFENSQGVIKSNVKVRFLNENKNILLIEVDNKSIYNRYKHVSIVAKNLLSKFGESIRANKETQLLDSFIKGGKRYFVVAEDLSNNYWVVKGEKLTTLKEDKAYVEPIQEHIITLNKSSIRKEARHNFPYKRNKRVIYTGGVI